jgi:8-oxo-dGTP pyrophosphatase MutT (NUDIX family)
MPYEGSYVQKLRRVVGPRLLLVPGAQVLLIDEADRVLLERDVATGLWCLPAGACEEGSSFASTAVAELREETGLVVDEAELTPFACLSDPAVHVIRYRHGDVTHCFAMCFEARTWQGDLLPEPEEVSELGFFALDDVLAGLPAELFPPTAAVIDLYEEYRRTGRFQAR